MPLDANNGLISGVLSVTSTLIPRLSSTLSKLNSGIGTLDTNETILAFNEYFIVLELITVASNKQQVVKRGPKSAHFNINCIVAYDRILVQTLSIYTTYGSIANVLLCQTLKVT